MTPLDVVDLLARHYEEARREVWSWPWPVFAALWARCIEDIRRRGARERRRKDAREAAATERELKRRLDLGE